MTRLHVVLAVALLSLSASACNTRPTLTVGRSIGEGAADSTIELGVGDLLHVELSRDYLPPTAQPSGVLERTSATGGYPSRKTMSASFKAIAAGRADIVSTTDFECLHSNPRCAIPQQQWTVHVVVRAS